MPTFDNLKSLEKFLNSAMADAMNNEVADKVRDVQASKVKTEVYDRYSPAGGTYAPRRNRNDGLMDKKHMKATVTQNANSVDLEVKNVAQGQTSPPVDYTSGTSSPNYLAGIIEYGRNNKDGLYAYNREGTEDDFLRPRPFTEETVEHLSSTGEHVDSLKKGLKRQGLDVQ